MGNLLSKLISDFGKCPNQKAHESECAGFLVRALPEVQDQIRKQFFDKKLYNYCSKKKLERFVTKNGVPKTGFPIVFSKSDLGGGDSFFAEIFF